MKKRLVIEGCFDLFHGDHRAFIAKCRSQFEAIYGCPPEMLVRVMSNAWTHRKGPFRPFQDIQERISIVQEHLGDRALVEEADKASFECGEQEFIASFKDCVVAITTDNAEKAQLSYGEYMVVEPIDSIHVTDIEKLLLSARDNSRCTVRRVGAVLLKDGNVLGYGSNECACSDEEACPACAEFLTGNIEVSRRLGCSGKHAEVSALSSARDARGGAHILLSTTAPCADCAGKIADAGVKSVVYLEEWKRLSPDANSAYIDTTGIELLLARDISVRKAGL